MTGRTRHWACPRMRWCWLEPPAFQTCTKPCLRRILISDSQQGGTVSPLVKGDMIYFETPGDGAVFSVGSIAWCGSLSHANYDNNVSRITENVLNRFAD